MSAAGGRELKAATGRGDHTPRKTVRADSSGEYRAANALLVQRAHHRSQNGSCGTDARFPATGRPVRFQTGPSAEGRAVELVQP